MFVGEARSRCFTWVGSGLTRKHQPRLERHAGDKRSSLLLTVVKSFIALAPELQLGSTVKQNLYNGEVSLAGGQVERRVPQLRRGLDVSTLLDQDPVL